MFCTVTLVHRLDTSWVGTLECLAMLSIQILLVAEGSCINQLMTSFLLNPSTRKVKYSDGLTVQSSTVTIFGCQLEPFPSLMMKVEQCHVEWSTIGHCRLTSPNFGLSSKSFSVQQHLPQSFPTVNLRFHKSPHSWIMVLLMCTGSVRLGGGSLKRCVKYDGGVIPSRSM